MRRSGPAMLVLLLVVGICAVALPIHAALVPTSMGQMGAMAGSDDGFTGPATEKSGVSPCCLVEALPAASTPMLPITMALALLLGSVLAWAAPSPLRLLPRADRWRPPGRSRFALFHAYLI